MLSELNGTLPTAAPGGGGGTGGCPPVGIQLEGLILPPVLTIDVVLGLLGNLVALWIFCFKLKTWNPNTLFLFNLVIADFLALVSLPLRIDALLRRHWVFGDGLCRINLFLMFSNRTASIALMTVVAIYRYFKVRVWTTPIQLPNYCSCWSLYPATFRTVSLLAHYLRLWQNCVFHLFNPFFLIWSFLDYHILRNFHIEFFITSVIAVGLSS